MSQEESPAVPPFSGNVRFVNFNQDFSSLAVGTHTGYRLFSVSSIDKIELIYEVEIGTVLIVERLFGSSLVTVVSEALPRRLQVCHFKKGTKVCEYDYSNTIVAVRLNRDRLVVCLEEALYVHNIRDMKLMHTIRDTPANARGVCALSANSDHNYLAYPGSASVGDVQVFDTIHMQAKTMLAAHDSPVAALSFSAAGTQLATASEKGTVIRVFCVHQATKLFELRRGLKRCAQISSMCFSPDAGCLAVSSNTETVHIFRLTAPSDAAGTAAASGAGAGGVAAGTVASSGAFAAGGPLSPHAQLSGTDTGSADVTRGGGSSGWLDYLNRAVSASTSYLPTQVADVLSQGRAFATVHLPVTGLRGVCGLVCIKKQLRLLVAAADGFLYIYNVESAEGGQCNLLKQHRLDGGGTESEHAAGDISSTSSAAAAVTANLMAVGASGGLSKLPEASMTGSYAGALRGRTGDPMSESERLQEMLVATEAPPAPGPYHLNDDDDFPSI